MLVLSATDVDRLLDLGRLVDPVEEAMIELSAGRARAGLGVGRRSGRRHRRRTLTIRERTWELSSLVPERPGVEA